jgi:hypothetical protein
METGFIWSTVRWDPFPWREGEPGLSVLCSVGELSPGPGSTATVGRGGRDDPCAGFATGAFTGSSMGPLRVWPREKRICWTAIHGNWRFDRKARAVRPDTRPTR